MREPVLLWEGPCAYVNRVKDGYEIIVHSTNCTEHVLAGTTEDGARAERICRRLNAYPKQTRHFHGLL